jgi:hypothetical protein
MITQDRIKQKRDEDYLAEQQKNKFIKNLEIIAGTVLIVLLVFALLLSSPYLAFAAVLSLAIPKLGEKLYSIFSSDDGINPNSQATREKPTLVSAVEKDSEIEQGNQASNVEETTKTKIKYGAIFKRVRGGLETDEEIMARGNEADLITAGKFIKR